MFELTDSCDKKNKLKLPTKIDGYRNEFLEIDLKCSIMSEAVFFVKNILIAVPGAERSNKIQKAESENSAFN